MKPLGRPLAGTLLAVNLTALSRAGVLPLDLAPKLKASTEVHYVSRGVIRHEVHPQTATGADKFTVQTEAGMTFRVSGVSTKGSATISWRLRYVSISSENTIPGLGPALRFDSRELPQNTSLLATLFAGLMDRPVTVHVDAAGRVTEIHGLKLPKMSPPLAGLVKSLFSRQAFEQFPLFVTGGAPSPVRLGSTWSSKSSAEMPFGVGSIALERRFALKRISTQSQTAAIEVDGKITEEPALGAGAEIPGPRGRGEALRVDHGTIEGALVWDYAAGQLSSAETLLTLQATVDTVVGRTRLKQEMSSFVRRSKVEEFGLPERPRPEPDKQEGTESRPSG